MRGGVAAVPPFSHFTAASELFVTAAVFYFFFMAMRRNDYRWGLVTITIAFETLVNITYMASRLTQHTTSGVDHPAWVTALLAGHGVLALAMFLGLVAYVVVAFRKVRVERDNLLARRKGMSYAFLVLWGLSVLSGELIYILQLSGAMRV